MDYPGLKAADAALPGAPLSLTAALAALAAQTVTSPPRDIAWASVRDVLMNGFDWSSLVAVADTEVSAALPAGAVQTPAIKAAAVAFRDCCIYGGVLNASNATVWARVVAAAALLTPGTVGGISSASATAVTQLRTPTLLAWVGVTAGDIQTARAQP